MMQSPYRTVVRTRSCDQIVTQVKELILSQQLKPGTRLPSERQMAQSFGVSRPIVREAMRILQREGLLHVKQGSGSFVREQSASAFAESLGFFLQSRKVTLSDLQQARKILEPEIAALAAEKAQPADLTAMQEHLTHMDESRDNGEAFIAADESFHAALAEATGNPTFLLMIEPVIGLLQEIRRLTSGVPGAFDRPQRLHRRLFDCICAGDANAARRAMQQHLRDVDEELSMALVHPPG